MASVVVGCLAAAPAQATAARGLKRTAHMSALTPQHTAKRSAALGPVTVCTSGTDVITHNETWSARAASSYLVGCLVEVAKGATLTIQKETVVKFGLGGSWGQFYVAPGGRLFAEGCPQPPHIKGHPWHRVPCPKQRIVFTTIYDNSVGGKTAPAGQAGNDSQYSHLIEMDGQSSVYVDYADVRHAAQSVVDGDPLQIAGCAVSGAESLTFAYTATAAPVSLGQCDGSNPSHFDISGDTFGLPAGTTGVSLAGKPTDSAVVEGDRFDYFGSSPTNAIMTNNLPVQGIALAGPTSSSFAGQGPLAVDLQNGIVPAGKSWAFASPDEVPLEGQIATAGQTLISAGARLLQTQLTVEPTGHLAVSGTPAHPAKFADGSWIDLTGSGVLGVTHALFAPGSNYGILEEGCQATGHETVTIEHSTIASPIQVGDCDSNGGDSIAVAQNHFVTPVSSTALAIHTPELNFSPPGHPGQLAITGNLFAPAQAKLTQNGPPEVSIYGWPVQGIALTGASANRFVGQGNGRVLDLTAATLPLGDTWTISPAPGEVLDAQTEYFYGNPGLAVQGKLVLDPGTIVKIGQGAAQAGGYGVGYGIGLANIGTLVAHGTQAHPVVFTSMNDSSVGGESLGVQSTPSQKDYKWAVSSSEGSTVDVSHAVFRYGVAAFQMQCGDTPQQMGGFDLTDSTIDAEISLGNCNGASVPYRPVIERNSFQFGGAPGGTYQPAVILYNADPTGIDLSGPNTNNFNGATNAGRVVALAGAEIPSGETWDVSGASGVVLAAWPDTDYLAPPGITLDGTMSLSNGVIVKSGISQPAVEVTRTGDLKFGGPASTPEIFTALTDDSVGGDSNGDGSASKPRPGAYGIAIQFDHLLGDMPVSDAVLKYASDALNYLYIVPGLAVSVSKSDFFQNEAAMEVEEDTGPDYDYLGQLPPCFPPWVYGVDANGDWFGPGELGWPAPDLDLASLVGAKLPGSIPFESSAFNWSGVGQLIDRQHLNFGKPNTVPWAIYSCSEGKIKIPIIPLSAVAVNNSVPAAPNYPGDDK